MRRAVYPYVAFLLVLIATGSSSRAQSQAGTFATKSRTEPTDTPERRHAFELYTAGKLVDAMPLLESLAAEYPADPQIREAWAFSIFAYSMNVTEPEMRTKARIRARLIAGQAQKMGDNSPLLRILLGMPADGSEPPFSSKRDVDEAIKSAESDFARGDWDKAREGYLRASLLDPKNYEAALFIGDTYFRQHSYFDAGEWFARATQIDANRETAYRYWGDALLQAGNSADAREKYIAAVIAEPYDQRSWGGLSEWAQKNKVQLNWVRLQDRAKLMPTASGPRVILDPSFHSEDPMFSPWMAYVGRRIQWQKEEFQQKFPNEPYRHTLAEEVDALKLMILAFSQPNFAGKLEPPFAALVQVDQAGLIEPFALLNRADVGLAQDYPKYKAAHQDLIYRYLDEFVVPKRPVAAAAN